MTDADGIVTVLVAAGEKLMAAERSIIGLQAENERLRNLVEELQREQKDSAAPEGG